MSGISPAGSVAVVLEISPPAPRAAIPRTRNTAIALLILVSNMDFTTPSVKAMTLAERRTLAAAPSAADKHAAVTVATTRSAGTQAEAAPSNATVTRAPGKPRRASRFASMLLPRARRLATVPSAQPSWRATSLRVFPSRSHRTTAARYFSANCPSSWSSTGHSSAHGFSSGSTVLGSTVASLARRRTAALRASRAVR